MSVPYHEGRMSVAVAMGDGTVRIYGKQQLPITSKRVRSRYNKKRAQWSSFQYTATIHRRRDFEYRPLLRIIRGFRSRASELNFVAKFNETQRTKLRLQAEQKE